MSEQTQNNSQTIVIALVVVAVLLAGIVGVLIYQQNQTAKLAALTPVTPAAPANSSAAPPSTGQPGAAAAGEFDAKTATKVPAGMTPLALVKQYNELVIDGKYDAAYKLLPLDKQTSYVDAKSYAAQVKPYGITSYKIGTPTETGDTFSVAAEQVTPQMPITYTWAFKKVGGQWYVASRTMGGSAQ